MLKKPLKTPRRISVTGVALTLTAICAVASAQLPTQPESILSKLKNPVQSSAFSGSLDTDRSFNRLIIKFKQPAKTHAGVFDHRAAEGQVTTLSAKTKAANPNANGLSRLKSVSEQTHVALTDKNMTRAELFVLAKQLEQDPTVEYAEIDERLQALQVAPTDPFYASQQWHYQAPANFAGGANLPLAWTRSTGNSAVVAVIDTGFRPHADLVTNLLPGYDFISSALGKTNGGGLGSSGEDFGSWTAVNHCGPNSSASDSSWHGTHVAGTVAAAANNGIGGVGVAFNAKILPVRVLGPCGGNSSDAVAGLRWAAGLVVPGVPTNLNKAKVLNLSLGATEACSTTFQTAINEVRSAGSIVVAATGNDYANFINTPANCMGVIAVTAHTQLGDSADYANVGSGTHISAPGGGLGTLILGTGAEIYSTLNTGLTIPLSDSYRVSKGTSMATPHVAGVAALLASLQPAITPNAVLSVLTNSVRAFPAGTFCAPVSPPAVQPNCGAGMLDAKAAIDRLNSLAPTASASITPGVKLTGSTVALTGVATPKVGGNPTFSYQWTQLNGSAVTLLTSNSASASFIAPARGGVYSFLLKATDGSGLAATSQVTVTTNTAPVLTAVPSQLVVLGENLSFTASATDTESNPIVYVGIGLPAGAALNAATGVFTWTNAGPVGNYSFTITPNDGMHNGVVNTVSVSVAAPPPSSALAPAAASGGGGGSLGAWDLLGMLALSLVALTSFRRQSAKK